MVWKRWAWGRHKFILQLVHNQVFTGEPLPKRGHRLKISVYCAQAQIKTVAAHTLQAFVLFMPSCQFSLESAADLVQATSKKMALE